MFRSRVFRRLYIPFVLVICAVALTVGAIGSHRLRGAHIHQARGLLAGTSALVTELLSDELSSDDRTALRREVGRLSSRLGYRITVIGPDAQGTVLAESDSDPETMMAHRSRPEVVMAFSTGDGWDLRVSETTGIATLYHASRVDVGERVAYIRVGIRLDELTSSLNQFYLGIAIAAALCMALAALVAYYITRRLVVPVVELTRFADAVAHGQIDRRILRSDPGELGVLARSLNSMADSLTRLLRQAETDRTEMHGILSSMSEGVIATDDAGKVLLVNAAAARLLGFASDNASGHAIWEIVKDEPILRAFDQAITQPEPHQFIATLTGGRQVEVTICPLAEEVRAGLILVIHDVTQAMRYQGLRKEFVANVSHELRTPLTVIKGYVETLRDGAVNDPVRRDEYLATVERHANQLTNLVGDLLELSRLENQPSLSRRGTVDLNAIVQHCLTVLSTAAGVKRLQLHLEPAAVSPPLVGYADYIERAVINLLDNAVKYTPAEGKVNVRVTQTAEHAIVEVTDNGIGIPPEDIERIFERFYRVDRSRSREMGGTGLGLAIVKHIVQAHGGKVEVQSTVNEGSTFRIMLPLAKG